MSVLTSEQFKEIWEKAVAEEKDPWTEIAKAHFNQEIIIPSERTFAKSFYFANLYGGTLYPGVLTTAKTLSMPNLLSFNGHMERIMRSIFRGFLSNNDRRNHGKHAIRFRCIRDIRRRK